MEIKLNAKTLLFIIIAIIVIIVIWQTVQIAAIGSSLTSSAPVASGGGMIGGC